MQLAWRYFPASGWVANAATRSAQEPAAPAAAEPVELEPPEVELPELEPGVALPAAAPPGCALPITELSAPHATRDSAHELMTTTRTKDDEGILCMRTCTPQRHEASLKLPHFVCTWGISP